jgi:hypothetical protein
VFLELQPWASKTAEFYADIKTAENIYRKNNFATRTEENWHFSDFMSFLKKIDWARQK